MKWFRFYSSSLHDAKLLHLSDFAFRFWVNLLCLANEQEQRGTLPSLEDIGIIFRMKGSKVNAAIKELVDAKLLDADDLGGYRPHNWDSRQRKSDDTASRVSTHRKNKIVTLQETLLKRDCSATVAPRARSESDSESDTDALAAQVRAEPAPIRQEIQDAIEQLERLTDSLFPATGWHVHARNACGLYPIAWVTEAVQIGAEKRATTWAFVRSILESFKARGSSDSERRLTTANGTLRAKPSVKASPERKAEITRSIMEQNNEHS